MQEFTKDQCIHRLQAGEPIGSVRPGEEFKVDVESAFGRSFTDKAEFEAFMRSPEKNTLNHPCTGPVLIEGVGEGVSLAINIRNITLTHVMQCLSTSTGILKGEFEGRRCHVHTPNEDGDIQLGDSVIIKKGPSIGVMASLDNVNRSPGRCSELGGNLDIPLAQAGRTIYLPVNHEKALLAVGDLHLRQGLGEILGMAFEASGSVNLSIDVAEKIPFPVIDGNGATAVMGWGYTLEEARKSVVNNTLDYLERLPAYKNWERAHLYQVLGGFDLIPGNSTGKVKTYSVVIRKWQMVDPVSKQTILLPPKTKESSPEQNTKYTDILSEYIPQYDNFDVLHTGDSREIRALPERDDLVISRLKPTIYSFEAKGAIEAPGTEKVRAAVNQLLCDHLHKNGIKTSTLATKGEYVLLRKEKVPNIEVVIKAALIGSPKHLYKDIDKHPTRNGEPLKAGEEHDPYERFDWRIRPPGEDTAMPPGLANKFIITENAKDTSLRAFDILRNLFRKHDLELRDGCFFMNEFGDTICAEVSPDNLGIVYTGENETYKAIFENKNKENTIIKWKLIQHLLST